MYARLTANCDRISVSKTVSKSVSAFDENLKEIKGLRKNETMQIASFGLYEVISHPDIPADIAANLEKWRQAQVFKIREALLTNAAAGKLGGTPLAKTKSDFGDRSAKIGEFSGVIDSPMQVAPSFVKSFVTGSPERKPVSSSEEIRSDAVSSKLYEMTEQLLAFIHGNGGDGKTLFTLDEALDMRAAYSALGCALDTRGIGYKVQGKELPRNPSEDGAARFLEMKKKITG